MNRVSRLGSILFIPNFGQRSRIFIIVSAFVPNIILDSNPGMSSRFEHFWLA
jgi:hypothetical protein